MEEHSLSRLDVARLLELSIHSDSARTFSPTVNSWFFSPDVKGFRQLEDRQIKLLVKLLEK